jgi:uncharacterized coiled-coil protein SlyX
VSIPKSSSIVRQTQPVDFYTILKKRVDTRRNKRREAVLYALPPITSMKSNIQGNDSPTTDSESVNINQLVSRVEKLERKVDTQQDTIESQQETIDEQQNQIESQQETIDEQQNQIESQQDEIDELRQELTEHQEKSIRKIAETMKDVNQIQESLEADSDGITPTPNDGQTARQNHELTPVEQIARGDTENLDKVIDSPSVRRAISLFKNIADWGNRTPKGIVLKSSDNPLSLLSADMDNSLCWKQYYRAAEALEGLSEGAVTFVNSDRHGKMVILHEHSDVSQRMKNGTLSVSSESTTV